MRGTASLNGPLKDTKDVRAEVVWASRRLPAGGPLGTTPPCAGAAAPPGDASVRRDAPSVILQA
jgi:hypothetical protein